MSTPKIGGNQPPTPPVSNTDAGDVQGTQTPKQPVGPSTKDTFETSGKSIDLFPKDVLQKAAKLTPQQELNAHLNICVAPQQSMKEQRQWRIYGSQCKTCHRRKELKHYWILLLKRQFLKSQAIQKVRCRVCKRSNERNGW